MRLLKKEVGDTKAIISYREPFRVLISTVLSQRTRDSRTLKASSALFSKYPGAESLSKAPLKAVEKTIRQVGFYRQKAKKIRETSRIIAQDHRGSVPNTFDGLLALPGVGRKTANCVLVYAFKKPAIPVDTHVHRITNRLGIVRTKTPEETETALSKAVPDKYWIEINELLVKFGQRKCFPRNPNCRECALRKHCDYYRGVFSLR